MLTSRTPVAVLAVVLTVSTALVLTAQADAQTEWRPGSKIKDGPTEITTPATGTTHPGSKARVEVPPTTTTTV